MPTRFIWAYHLSHEELMEVFLDAGGSLGSCSKDDLDILHYARRAIFQYLMPGDVRVWYGALDDNPGVIFVVGKRNAEFESIPKKLLARCYDMFLCPPDWYTRVHDPDYEHAKFSREQDGKTHTLARVLFFESNHRLEDYPWGKHGAPPP